MNCNDIIIDKEALNITQTLECGQFFRYKNHGTHYTVKSLGMTAILHENSDSIVIESENKNYFYNFFDLDTDYDLIKKQLLNKPFMKEAIANGSGIRILRQDPMETIINFIISANNNIGRIKNIIEKICVNGAFPSLEELSQFTEDDFALMGAGYRANYLKETILMLKNDIEFVNATYALNTQDAIKHLMKLKGVGAKVADCILLFGYYRMDTFPVDTWIRKVYADIFDDNINSPTIMHDKLLAEYGELSGYAQQYLFYNKRSFS